MFLGVCYQFAARVEVGEADRTLVLVAGDVQVQRFVVTRCSVLAQKMVLQESMSQLGLDKILLINAGDVQIQGFIVTRCSVLAQKMVLQEQRHSQGQIGYWYLMLVMYRYRDLSSRDVACSRRKWSCKSNFTVRVR